MQNTIDNEPVCPCCMTNPVSITVETDSSEGSSDSSDSSDYSTESEESSKEVLLNPKLQQLLPGRSGLLGLRPQEMCWYI